MTSTSAAHSGLGVVLERLPLHEPIAEITDFGEYGVTRADLDVTNHDSSGNAEEYIAGLIQGGEFTVTANMISGDTSGQMKAITQCLAGTIGIYIIRLPNTSLSTYEFYGYCKSYKIKAETKGVIKMTMTFKVAKQAPTFTVTGV